MKRVVLDTNVVVSACFWHGPSWQCLEAWASGRFIALVSPPMLTEYAEVFERLRQRYPDKPRVDWVSALRDDAELVFPAIRIPDADARPVFRCGQAVRGPDLRAGGCVQANEFAEAFGAIEILPSQNRGGCVAQNPS